jgi:hypothetical protein
MSILVKLHFCSITKLNTASLAPVNMSYGKLLSGQGGERPRDYIEEIMRK